MCFRSTDYDKIYQITNEIKSNDQIFYKVFIALKNDDKKTAINYIRLKYNIGMLDAKRAVLDAEKTYTHHQRDSLLKFIFNNNPEYVI